MFINTNAYHSDSNNQLAELVKAATRGEVNRVKCLLSSSRVFPGKYYVDGKAYTSPLLEAAVHAIDFGKREEYFQIISLLLQCNANINEADACHNTALSAATYNRDLDLMKELLNHGAEIDKRTEKLAEARPSTLPILTPYNLNKDPINWVLKNKEITLGEISYRILGFLGGGSHGAVFKAEDQDTNDIVAIKLLYEEDDIEVDNYLKMQRMGFTHPNVVEFKGTATSKGKKWIIMEYIKGTTRSEYSNWNQSLAEQANAGYRALLDSGIKVNRENDDGNILITSVNGIPTVKIIDLGQSYR